MTRDPRIPAIVLAAGRSSRMGRPKPLVPIAGKPMLAHLLERLTRSRIAEILVVLGPEAEAVRAQVDLHGARVVLNPDYRQGISSSVRAGVREAGADAEGYLFALGDQPFVDPSTFDRLTDTWLPHRDEILVPTFQGRRGNPVVVSRELGSEADALRGDVGFRALFDAHARALRQVPVDDPGILIDMDTPEQVDALEARLGKGIPLQDALRALVTLGSPRSGMA